MENILIDKLKNRLIIMKELLVDYIDIVQFDYDSIEYLIDTIDYILQGRIPCNNKILSIVMEDVMIAGTFHKSKQLLKVVSIIKEMMEILNNV